MGHAFTVAKSQAESEQTPEDPPLNWQTLKDARQAFQVRSVRSVVSLGAVSESSVVCDGDGRFVGTPPA